MRRQPTRKHRSILARAAQRRRPTCRVRLGETLERRALLSADPTTISITASQDRAVYGQPLDLTATVLASPTDPSQGTVTFNDGAAVLGTAPVNFGAATLSDVRLPVGSHQFTASYSDPQGDFGPSSTIAEGKAPITTVAGVGVGDNLPALLSKVHPMGVAVDAAGNLFIADYGDNRIREVSHATGVITTVAGNGVQGFSGDGGAATSAELNYPSGVAVDTFGNLFIADTLNNRVREVDHATGVITTVAGMETSASGRFAGDGGLATLAALNLPEDIALDSSGNLFIDDRYNNRVREVRHATGVINTVAGGGLGGDGGDAVSAELNDPFGIALDATGNLFIADAGDNRVRKVDAATGVITTVAGGGSGGDGGPAITAALNNPGRVMTDASGNLFIADSGDNRIREVDRVTGVISTFAGNGDSRNLAVPRGMALNGSGDLFIADYGNARVLEVNHASGVISTIAGLGPAGFSGDGGAATAAELRSPSGVAVDQLGNLFIADSQNNRIREVNHATGAITTVAGDGTYGFYGDGGPAALAKLNYPTGVAVDESGGLFIADAGNDRIRKVNLSTGVITTVAGDGTGGFAGDGGPATAAEFIFPTGVAVDGVGDLFIADSQNNRIRKVDHATHEITTLVQVQGAVAGPEGVAVDASDDVFIADTQNNRILEVDHASGATITASSGAQLNRPTGVAVDAIGNLFIANTDSSQILEVDHGTGAVKAIAGGNGPGFGGDEGIAGAAALNYPEGVAVDSSGDIFIADTSNHVVREVLNGTQTVITPAPLTIAADDKNKMYGADLPALTASYSGFVDGDTAASLTAPPTLSTVATAASHVSGSPYAITASGAVDSDYTISYVPGKLTVTPAPLTITADDKTKPFGAELPPLTASYSGLVNGDGAASLTAQPTLSTTASESSPVGAYPIALAGAVDSDYSINHVPGALTVTASSVSYASPGGDVTVTVVDAKLEIVAAGTIVSTTPLADVASVTINGADGVANNFTLDYSNGTFIVPSGITFNGGALPATPSNSLSIVGGEFDTDTFDFSSAHDGSIELGTNGQLVSYTNMTPLTNTGTAANAVFKLPDGTVVASLGAGAASGTVQLVSGNGAFETTTLPAPSGSLTVNAGSGSDTVTTTNGFYANLDGQFTVHGAANTLPLRGFGVGPLTAVEGAERTQPVVAFADPNGAGVAGDYSATIDWGDGGSTSAGTISGPGPEGLFNVTGTHTYAQASATSETVKVTLHRAGAADVTVASALSVGIAPPSGTPHERFVAAVYEDVLGRAPDANGLAYWSQKLDGGMAVSSVAEQIGKSNEYYQNFVIKPDYLKLLGRAADADGLSHWTTQMDAGTTDQQLEADLAASAEVYAKAGGTTLAWVDSVYKLLLNRTAEADGEKYWTGKLTAGASRINVAQGIAGSNENNTQLINDDYFHYLGRAADADGLAYWLAKFAEGQTNEDVIAGFTGSDEYYKKHTS